MTMQYSGVLTIRNLYILGLLTIAASLPSSPYFTSIGQWIIALAWISDKKIVLKLKSALKNKALLIFLSFYLLHIISLLWSTDYTYGLHDIKIKLPLLVIPLIVTTSTPLSKREIIRLFWVYSLSVLIVSFIGMYSLYFSEQGAATDFRSISPFISHIRLSLMINLSIVALLCIVFEEKKLPISIIIIHFATIIYFIVFLIVMRSLTGIVVFCALALFLFLYKILRTKAKTGKWVLHIALICTTLFFIYFLVHSYSRYSFKANEPFDQLEKITVNGNKYSHDTLSIFRENGHLVNINICEKEMRQEWNKIERTHYDSIGSNKYPIKAGIMRYLTSKGLTKDSVGISKLTPLDINAIENGISNNIYLNRHSLYPRLYELFWEVDFYRRGGNPSGHSIIQRIYYLEAGWNIFLENPTFGVGVGDVKSAYSEYYTKTNSPLTNRWRLRAHNQFLTILLSFGIIGFLIFIISQLYPVLVSKKAKNISKLFAPFIIISLLSMLNEDTLETQAGVTFYAFFYSLFIWGINHKKKANNESE